MFTHNAEVKVNQNVISVVVQLTSTVNEIMNFTL